MKRPIIPNDLEDKSKSSLIKLITNQNKFISELEPKIKATKIVDNNTTQKDKDNYFKRISKIIMMMMMMMILTIEHKLNI
jgi:hypothetical protein